MHEMSVAQNIIDIVLQHLPDQNAHTVKSVNVKIGKMAGIVPDSLEFSFRVIAADTPCMIDAELKMQLVPLIIRCNGCTKETNIDDPVFMCPGCNSADVTVLSGTELQVSEIEIEDTT